MNYVVLAKLHAGSGFKLSLSSLWRNPYNRFRERSAFLMSRQGL